MVHVAPIILTKIYDAYSAGADSGCECLQRKLSRRVSWDVLEWTEPKTKYKVVRIEFRLRCFFFSAFLRFFCCRPPSSQMIWMIEKWVRTSSLIEMRFVTFAQNSNNSAIGWRLCQRSLSAGAGGERKNSITLFLIARTARRGESEKWETEKCNNKFLLKFQFSRYVNVLFPFAPLLRLRIIIFSGCAVMNAKLVELKIMYSWEIEKRGNKSQARGSIKSGIIIFGFCSPCSNSALIGTAFRRS